MTTPEASRTSTPVVDLETGRLAGADESGVAVFRGVPYAAPPVGELRWRPARPHPGWSGTRDATVDGPSAPQMYLPHGDPILGGHGAPPFSDDCLTLNVWTPSVDDAARPVLVWIHGGGFVSGSGSLPIYSGRTLADNGDLVVVSVNYRIGALGYLCLDDADDADESANVWITDLVAALHWVRQNIARFGGDPDRVTVAGQSGGALSTAALTGHPKARHLFQRAILQSPPLGLELPDRAAYARHCAGFLDLLGTRDPAELRAMQWERLIHATGAFFAATSRWGYWATPFLPVVDDATMARHPVESLLQDADPDIDVLIGWTREEATFGFALSEEYATATQERVVRRLAETFGARDAATAYRAYAAARPGSRPVDVLTDLITDELFRIPAVNVAEARAESGRPVWAYQFDYPTPAHEGLLGATHCLELPFVFDNFDQWAHAPFVADMPPQSRDALARAMHRAWISFARTGDPNHDGLPVWDRYDRPSRGTMRFDTITGIVHDPAEHSRGLFHRRG
ncbi:carboxylesterase family protein [Nocardiopsis sp. NPDC049922]|uniref:carboxylesterase/lipase family protein n=1 Tax=Nocardiopsis sp. NPDC049922 TaxID=3155157 RepID=UPI0033E633A8